MLFTQCTQCTPWPSVVQLLRIRPDIKINTLLMKRASSSHPLSYISTLVLQAVYWAEALANSLQFPATQCHRGWMEVCVGPKASQISCLDKDKGGSLRGHLHPAATTPMCHAIVLCFHFQKELTQNVTDRLHCNRLIK